MKPFDFEGAVEKQLSFEERGMGLIRSGWILFTGLIIGHCVLFYLMAANPFDGLQSNLWAQGIAWALRLWLVVAVFGFSAACGRYALRVAQGVCSIELNGFKSERAGSSRPASGSAKR